MFGVCNGRSERYGGAFLSHGCVYRIEVTGARDSSAYDLETFDRTPAHYAPTRLIMPSIEAGGKTVACPCTEDGLREIWTPLKETGWEDAYG